MWNELHRRWVSSWVDNVQIHFHLYHAVSWKTSSILSFFFSFQKKVKSMYSISAIRKLHYRGETQWTEISDRLHWRSKNNGEHVKEGESKKEEERNTTFERDCFRICTPSKCKFNEIPTPRKWKWENWSHAIRPLFRRQWGKKLAFWRRILNLCEKWRNLLAESPSGN